jgi:glucose-6-phosphate dehydrogenase assembly protein OpcA
VDLARDETPGAEKHAEGGVLRACSMTLVTCVDETDDPNDIGETLALLMREHPSRAIVIRVRGSIEPHLESRVFAQCWMPFGKGRQICCEQVEIIATDVSLEDLPPVILPLVVADLPLMLWCRSSRAVRLPAFDKLAGLASKLIVDSANIPDPFPRLLSHPRTADLAWTRLTRWRELLAQIFENRCYLKELPSITRVRIVHEGLTPATSSFYMGAWIAGCLEKAGANPELIWEHGPQSSVILEANGAVHTSIIQSDEANIVVRVGKNENHAVFTPHSEYTLLREELSIPGRDMIFEATLARAAGLADLYRKEHP